MTWFQEKYSVALLKRDLIAGLTVALFTVPQAMAYALIAGFSPQAGIATAIVASIFGAIFGSSEFLINGPTNAISVMLASNAALFAAQGDAKNAVVLATLMIGIGQCIAAAVKAGKWVRFVSEPVLVGFTCGAGIYIAVNQLPTALGLSKKQVPEQLWGWAAPHDVVLDIVRAFSALAHLNPIALAICLGSIVLVRLLQWAETKFSWRIPAPFISIVVISVIAFLLHLGDKSAGEHKIKLVRDIEPVKRALPTLMFPTITLKSVTALAGTAFAIGLLGAVEAIAIGKALAAKVGKTFDANRQLIGEGACNIAAALVGGFASSGSFSRSAVNFEAGAVTRWSCILSGVLVAGLVLLFGDAANYIPTAALAGLLIHIGFKLVNVGKMKLIAQTTAADRRTMAWTFFAVLLLPDLSYALFFGVLTAVFHALRRAEGFKLVRLVEVEDGHIVERPDAPTGDPVVAFDLQGELFFAAAEELEKRLIDLVRNESPFVVLRLQQAYNMDLTIADVLINVAKRARERGGRLILSGIRPGMYGTLERAGVIAALGEDSVFPHETTLLGATHKALEFGRSLASGDHLPNISRLPEAVLR